MYLSKEQVAVSIERLENVSVFFGTVFLAFKQIQLPIGDPQPVIFKKVVDAVLHTYYLSYPPDKQTKDGHTYTPFLTSQTRHRWNKEPFSDSLRRTTDMFADAFQLVRTHKRNSRAWQPDYVQKLLGHLSERGFIPAFDLAVWLFRERAWPEDTQPEHIMNVFVEEFLITEDEKILFDFSLTQLASPLLDKDPLSYEDVIEMVGIPLSEGGATLEWLQLTEVGPAKQVAYDFTPRLNIITGDNGLGKTFLLECAWWALTGSWARADYPAYPRRSVPKNVPGIAFKIGRDSENDQPQVFRYDWDRQEWAASMKRDVLPGLSLFAEADGSFVVWDSAKHLLLEQRRGSEARGAALIRFSRAQIWEGLQETVTGRTLFLCNGLVRDWHIWQTSEPERFEEFCVVLHTLSPEHPLIPGEPTRLPPDSRPMPTLHFPYGDVPIILCSAGIQRILTLAYVLLWAWHEHRETSQSLRREPERSIVFFVDEMEAHLHPFWQRMIVPALLDVVHQLSHEVQTQLIVATRSPLVLASVEDRFDPHTDSLFHLYLHDDDVKLAHLPFAKRGRVDLWLMSDLFGLKHPRSKAAEDAIEEAKELQRIQAAPKEEIQKVYEKLERVLAEDDEFWPRWTYFAETHGVLV